LEASEDGDLAIVGHGGTGTLLYCHLAGLPINRRYDQPATNGGNWFAFDRTNRELLYEGWQSIDVAAGIPRSVLGDQKIRVRSERMPGTQFVTP
jgi:broad specificity phosphatase PhoE